MTTNSSAARCIQDILRWLYPAGDADHEWSVGTIDEVANVLSDYGFGPHAKAKTMTDEEKTDILVTYTRAFTLTFVARSEHVSGFDPLALLEAVARNIPGFLAIQQARETSFDDEEGADALLEELDDEDIKGLKP